MKVQDVMTQGVIPISAEETAEVAARTFAHYNIGALPVCDTRGRLCGMVTDRDLVTRCLAAGRSPSHTTVRQIMTGRVVSVDRNAPLDEAASLMAQRQIRRLPVTEDGKLCGMLSLGDLSKRPQLATQVLQDVSSNISHR